MPLQSSGQIALSEIRNEFGLGSGQIAMSQLYGKGNAPASSGQILMAANFYGVSSFSGFANTNIGSGTHTTKASPTLTRRYGYSDGVTSPAMGSIVDNSISNSGATIRQMTTMTGFSPFTNIQFSSAYTSWTSIKINNSITYTRASANVNNGNKDYRWNGAGTTSVTNLKIL